MYLQPQIDTHGAFVVIRGHAQKQTTELPSEHVPSWGQTRTRSAFWFQLFYYKWIHGLFMSYFFAFCAVFWWFCCGKWPQAFIQNCYFSVQVPKSKKAVMCLLEKMCVWDKLPSGMSYGAVGCEFILMNQQHALNKIHSTQTSIKQGYISISWQNCAQDLAENWPCISRSNGSVSTNSVFSTTS